MSGPMPPTPVTTTGENWRRALVAGPIGAVAPVARLHETLPVGPVVFLVLYAVLVAGVARPAGPRRWSDGRALGAFTVACVAVGLASVLGISMVVISTWFAVMALAVHDARPRPRSDRWAYVATAVVSVPYAATASIYATGAAPGPMAATAYLTMLGAAATRVRSGSADATWAGGPLLAAAAGAAAVVTAGCARAGRALRPAGSVRHVAPCWVTIPLDPRRDHRRARRALDPSHQGAVLAAAAVMVVPALLALSF